VSRSIVKLPKVADTVDEVLLLEWLVPIGGKVSAGDPIVRVETDKVEMEVPTPVGGTLVETLVPAGEEVATGAGLCVIET
jgi:2-oxoglutarate dehydrogenase E2 component (dihydrolipoamide succinyltransferase)